MQDVPNMGCISRSFGFPPVFILTGFRDQRRQGFQNTFFASKLLLSCVSFCWFFLCCRLSIANGLWCQTVKSFFHRQLDHTDFLMLLTTFSHAFLWESKPNLRAIFVIKNNGSDQLVSTIFILLMMMTVLCVSFLME